MVNEKEKIFAFNNLVNILSKQSRNRTRRVAVLSSDAFSSFHMALSLILFIDMYGTQFGRRTFLLYFCSESQKDMFLKFFNEAGFRKAPIVVDISYKSIFRVEVKLIIHADEGYNIFKEDGKVSRVPPQIMKNLNNVLSGPVLNKGGILESLSFVFCQGIDSFAKDNFSSQIQYILDERGRGNLMFFVDHKDELAVMPIIKYMTKNINVISPFSDDSGVNLDIESDFIEKAIPNAQVAPIKIEVTNNRFSASKQKELTLGLESQSREVHSELIQSAEDCRGRIGSNHPVMYNSLGRYLSCLGENIDDMQAIRLGALGIRLKGEASGYYEDGVDPLSPEQRQLLTGLLTLHEFFIRLIPEWREFVADAEKESLSPQATDQMGEVAAGLVDETRANPDAFDPEIPDILESLPVPKDQESPEAKVSALALKRSLNNMLGAMGRYLVDFSRKCAEKTSEKVSDAVASSLALAARGVVLALGHKLLALAELLPGDFGWVKSLIEFIRTLPPGE